MLLASRDEVNLLGLVLDLVLFQMSKPAKLSLNVLIVFEILRFVVELMHRIIHGLNQIVFQKACQHSLAFVFIKM